MRNEPSFTILAKIEQNPQKYNLRFDFFFLVFLIKEKVENVEGKSVDLSGIENNLKKIGKNKDAIAEVEKKASVNEKTLQLFKLEIEEIKIKNKNPLGG